MQEEREDGKREVDVEWWHRGKVREERRVRGNMGKMGRWEGMWGREEGKNSMGRRGG